MNLISIKPFNVITNSDLPELMLEEIPSNGDPMEINGDLYFVCERIVVEDTQIPVIGVIPLIISNPAKIPDIKKYIECLSLAHRKVQFRNSKGICDLENCDEMIIT
jgi:hypothetical protein